MSLWKKLAGFTLASVLAFSIAGAAAVLPARAETAEKTEVEKNGEIYILYTSDIHCGIDSGFGLVGLQQVRDNLESQGYTTILVDDGDAIQGELIGVMTTGEAIIDLMNDMKYDVAIPGNHEFDYGMDRFLELTEKADFPYICCNFVKDDELVFDPYTIIEAQGVKIAFVGVTTPTTITSSTPKFFQDENGNYIYGFMQDKTGEGVYEAVQSAVDSAREAGADYVYVMGHIGLNEAAKPWTYADIISHTSGIDVFLDGHSHDTEQITMKNKDGEDVARSACGTKMACIGYSHIAPENGVVETGIWSWPNKISAPELLGIDNEINEKVEEVLSSLQDELGKTVAVSDVLLTINDPDEVTEEGEPIRMVRRAETNLGDFCADAFRIQMDTDISLINGGAVRVDLNKGDITYGDVVDVMPFCNGVCVIEATGQQILDALEWTARSVPSENGGFLQVSGMSYTIDLNTESSCTSDEEGMFDGFSSDDRRVRDVLVNGEPIDPEKTYTVAGTDYVLVNSGDGQTAFSGCKLLQDQVMLDNEALIKYVEETLSGEIGGDYADPYGQGRITIIEAKE